MMGTLCLSAMSRISLRWAGEKTEPQGLEGELTMMAAVLWSMRDSMWPKSTIQSWSGSRSYSRVWIPKPAERVV